MFFNILDSLCEPISISLVHHSQNPFPVFPIGLPAPDYVEVFVEESAADDDESEQATVVTSLSASTMDVSN
jgi:hypothetical protein